MTLPNISAADEPGCRHDLPGVYSEHIQTHASVVFDGIATRRWLIISIVSSC
ncbi:hypothetical protein [Methylobacter svalbardensis]|uniref:hypothetical protein n=1 Tax=Methylobacter svalbardensis TaxID=3080016 RepID=UPI0030ED6B41